MKSELENILENQKDIAEVYQELSYDELSDMQQQLVNSEDGETGRN